MVTLKNIMFHTIRLQPLPQDSGNSTGRSVVSAVVKLHQKPQGMAGHPVEYQQVAPRRPVHSTAL
jgi:hypothetical protein